MTARRISRTHGRPAPRSRSRDKFRDKDVGYFELDDSKLFMEVRDKLRVYYNVHSFVKAAKLAESTIRVSSMRRRFAQCFLGKASTWYEHNLSDAERAALTDAPTMDVWYDALRERFAMPVTEARNIYNKLQYTLYNVYERDDPDDFLQKIVVYGQEAREATTEQAQAQAAYNKLSPPL